jgi:hypothetical protein
MLHPVRAMPASLVSLGILGLVIARPRTWHLTIDGPGAIGLVAFGCGGAMAEVVETHDLTAPSQDGWAVDYRIRREDGEELHAEVRCWKKAHAAAGRAANADALAAIADRGSAAALEYAELVESPATRGAVLISIWFDPADEGNLRRRVSYERAPA